ncbi:hypothetical protein M404DRAFT_866695 [Pisolithus tinctorius Marx 270]|uniref:Uncharacterized protein n=1 Tax=Pisolithus tinctorius Marx 270 TaxID=870435 RepID=A0A0C3NQV5_PISTI|nr:hypothetical protein M404DRAFT_866695 [Pisolithus tinctorius Marx 270]
MRRLKCLVRIVFPRCIVSPTISGIASVLAAARITCRIPTRWLTTVSTFGSWAEKVRTSDGMTCTPQCEYHRGRSYRGPVLHPSPRCCIATAVHMFPRIDTSIRRIET